MLDKELMPMVRYSYKWRYIHYDILQFIRDFENF